MSPERVGCILTSLNLITPHDMEGPLRLHLSGAVHRLYALKRGTFSFREGRLPEIYYPNSSNGASPATYLENIQKQNPAGESMPFIDQKISSHLQDSPLENLKILNSGPIPSNSTELLGSRRMHELIDILKRRFDTIIFDSPPVNSVSDACILSSKVDGVILVVHVGRSNRKIVQKTKQQLESVGAKICGVILNRLNMKRDGYYYYGYYRYYHYGYYHQQNPD